MNSVKGIRILSVIICLALMAAGVLFTYSTTDTVVGVYGEKQLDYLRSDIYINSTHINNWELSLPFAYDENDIYVPMTYEMQEYLGLDFIAEEDDGILEIAKIPRSAEFKTDALLASNLTGSAVKKVQGYKVFAGEYLPDSKSAMLIDVISPRDLEGEDFELEISKNSLFITDGGVFYFPLSVLAEADCFNISYFVDPANQLYISTDPSADASTFMNSNNRSFIEGRARYMMRVNKTLTYEEALDLEYIIRHEASVIVGAAEEDTLISMIRIESGFYTDIGKRALGLMQIVGYYAERKGIPREDLLDPHVNVEYGAQYLKDRLDIFGGDEIKALSSYNQGIAAVKDGDFSTGYASKCLRVKEELYDFLKNNSYAIEWDYGE